MALLSITPSLCGKSVIPNRANQSYSTIFGANQLRRKRACSDTCALLADSQLPYSCPITSAFFEEHCDVIIQIPLLRYLSLHYQTTSHSYWITLAIQSYFDLLVKMSGKSENRRFFSRLRKVWTKNFRRLCCFTSGEMRLHNTSPINRIVRSLRIALFYYSVLGGQREYSIWIL